MSVLGVPIYIAETWIADAAGDRRPLWHRTVIDRWSVCAQGLKEMSVLDVPIYITETGIADAAGDRRPLWLETYIPEVERAVRDGMDVRGLMYWTLVDNFEVGAVTFHVQQPRLCAIGHA